MSFLRWTWLTIQSINSPLAHSNSHRRNKGTKAIDLWVFNIWGNFSSGDKQLHCKTLIPSILHQMLIKPTFYIDLDWSRMVCMDQKHIERVYICTKSMSIIMAIILRQMLHRLWHLEPPLADLLWGIQFIIWLLWPLVLIKFLTIHIHIAWIWI